MLKIKYKHNARYCSKYLMCAKTGQIPVSIYMYMLQQAFPISHILSHHERHNPADVTHSNFPAVGALWKEKCINFFKWILLLRRDQNLVLCSSSVMVN